MRLIKGQTFYKKPWYNSYRCMHSRYYRTKDPSYKYYGGRGIKVCSEWDSFDKFEKWAYENGYDDTLTIDRINNDKGYSPDNCRWVTPKQQANNRKSSVYIEHNGEKHTYAEWADIAGVNYKVFMTRVYRGYSLEDCMKQGRLRRNTRRVREPKPYAI